MPDFNVSTAFTSQDRVSSAFRNMGRNAGRFGNSASSAFRQAGRSGSRFGDIVKGILSASAIKAGLGLLRRGLSSVGTEFISFDDAATSAVSKFNEINIATDQGQKAFARLKAAARETGAATEKTATQSAQALDLLALAGFNLEQSIANLPGVVDLSTASRLEMDRATEISTKSLGAYGLKVKDITQLQKNFTRVTDLMVATTTTSETNLETLFESVAAGAGTFVSAGQQIETFNSLVGKLAGQAVTGEKAGTALRNIILRLAAPVPKAQKLLDKFGISVKDQEGNFRDIVDVIGDFEKQLKTVGDVQRLAALDTIFGKKSVEAFDKLIKIGSKDLRVYREELLQSGGTTKKIADIMRDSLGNRIRVLASSAIEMGFRFLEAFDGKGRKGITILTEAVRDFDMQPVVDTVKFAFTAFSDLLSLLREYRPIIEGIVIGFVAFGVAAKATAGFLAVKAWLGWSAALLSSSGAMGLLNGVMAANPIGAVALAVGLLVGGLVALQRKFGIFDNLFEKLMKLKNFVFDIGGSAFGGVADFFGFGEDEKGAKTQTPTREIIPPNREEIELRRQEINFNGQLNIAGAPPGSTFSGNTSGAPEIDVNLLGVNP